MGENSSIPNTRGIRNDVVAALKKIQIPVLRWPGFLELTIESEARDWVVYTEPPDAICVEPQTAPPDALDRDAALMEPGSPLVLTMTWRWRSLAG